MAIHVTAIVDHTAEVDPTAEIGPYCIIEPGVRIGEHTHLIANVYVCSGTRIGARCRVHPFAVLGDAPQDLSHTGAPSYVEIGDDNWIREGVTIHRGTEPDSVTRIGNGCFLMSNVHVAHNCQLADGIIIASGAVLAGRVTVGFKAFISGLCAIHQFVRVGEFSMIAGGFRAVQDVSPFMMVGGHGLVGPNVVGLRRGGFSSQERLELRELYRAMFRTAGNFQDKLVAARARARTEPGKRLLDFLASPSKRGLLGYTGFRGAPSLELPED